MKGQSKNNGSGQNLNLSLSSLKTGANDHTNNLPAISDILASMVKKRRMD
jgi:hypothetical protein